MELNVIDFLAGMAFGYLVRRVYLIWQIKRSARVLDLAREHGFKLKAGWSHNPTLNYPANYPCYCGSGFKFKKCCSQTTPRYVKTSAVAQIEIELQGCKALVEKGMNK